MYDRNKTITLILYSDKPLDFRFLILLLLAKNLKYLNQNFEVFFIFLFSKSSTLCTSVLLARFFSGFFILASKLIFVNLVNS